MPSSWELSPLYRHETSLASARSLLSASRDRLILRDLASLAITRTWKLPTTPSSSSSTLPLRETNSSRPPPTTTTSKDSEHPPQFSTLAISPHSGLILAHCPKARQAWILDPDKDDVLARIEIGDEGALAMVWSPEGEGDSVLIWSAHHLRISIYRISTPTPAFHIHNPKLVAPLGYSFRPADGRYLAVVERHSGRDHIGIYDAAAWRLIRHFPLPTPSSDVADLAWSPCGRYLAVWESLTDYILHIYTPDGRLISTFTPYATTLSSDDRREERSTSGWVGLGVRTVKWHPSGDWIAVGGWDGKIRVLTRLGWVPVAELSHPSRLPVSITAWREPHEWIERTRGKGIVAFDTPTLPLHLTVPRIDLTKVSPKMGISTLLWSPSGRFLASYNQSHPNVLWIHQLLVLSPTTPTPHFRPKLHSVVLLHSTLRGMEWKPPSLYGGGGEGGEREMIAVVTAQKGFVTWTAPGLEEGQEEVVEGVGIPARTAFAPSGIAFSNGGDAVVLSDKETYAVAYVVEEGAEEGERTWGGGEE